MTSKLDTAGLVGRLRYTADVNARKFDADHPLVGELRQAADLIEALTQAAVPDMEPVAWRGTNLDGESEAFLSEHQAAFWSNGACNTDPLVLRSAVAAQLSALQERAERAEANFREMTEKWRLASIDFDVADARAEAAEAHAAELEGRPDENGFIVGHPVEKFTGEARWEGTLVASYLTTKGKRRYVVEVNPQGFQMIAVPAQLRMIAALTDDEDGGKDA